MFDILMKKLSLKIPQFKLNRWIKAKLTGAQAKSPSSNLTISGIDANGSPYQLFKQIKINGKLSLPEGKFCTNDVAISNSADSTKVEFTFQGHY